MYFKRIHSWLRPIVPLIAAVALFIYYQSGSSVHAPHTQNTSNTSSLSLFDTILCATKGSSITLSDDFLKLLKKTLPAEIVNHVTLNGKSETINQLVELTQAKQPRGWIRDSQIRGEAGSHHNHNRAELLPILNRLGFVEATKPSLTSYDYALVAGSTVQGVRKRLAYLGKLHAEGVRFKALVFLTGYRPLYATETAEVLLGKEHADLPLRASWQPGSVLPTNEIEMVPWVFEQSELFETFKGIPITYIAGAALPGTPRARTDETIEAWKATNPTPGRCLLISDQPFVTYQHFMFQTLAGPQFALETVGPAAGNGTTLEIYLDSLARALWSEKKYLESIA